MIEQYRLVHALYSIDHAQRRVETMFDDGEITPGVPTTNARAVGQARTLGYAGTDDEVVWAMTCDHDLLHNIVSESAGHRYSPTLRWRIDGPPPKGVVPQEERTVFLVQRLFAELLRQGVPRREIVERVIGYSYTTVR